MTVGVAAAGSGGHVYPALAVAEALLTHGVSRDDIVFFGGDRIEATVIPEAGYPFVHVEIHGIRRSLSLDNLVLPMKVRRARKVIAEAIEARHIASMVVFGGYVSGPAALAARQQGIPLVVHEANAVPGVANRLIAGRADAVFAAFAPALDKLPMAQIVGNPLRSAFSRFDRTALRAEARTRYGVDQDAMVLAVVGGSLGASALNELAREMASSRDRTFHIIHVTGPMHIDKLSQEAASVDRWVVSGYEHDMPLLYAAADLVLARGGALTVAELHATQTPAIIVPLPAGRRYQALNAADAESAGGVVVIDQSDSKAILETVNALLSDRYRLEEMSASLANSPHRGAAEAVADRVLEVQRA